jgi:hypothetical protein
MGDALFAASAARKLKEEDQYDVVDLATGLKQVEELLAYDKYVDNIIRVEEPTIRPLHGASVDGYDAEFELTETNKVFPPPVQAQLECGVRTPDTKFEITVDPEIVDAAKMTYPDPYIAVMEMGSWCEKAFSFTQKQYEEGVDVPYLGYGGRLRDIAGILNRLQLAGYELVQVGLKAGIKSLQATQNLSTQFRSIAWDAAIIQNADYFIGAEGGLANVAAGVHTKTVLTGEFVHQLYGWNGVIKQIVNPKLGPRFYWPEDGHIDLNPYLTDNGVSTEMLAVFRGQKTAEGVDYGWTSPTI